MSTTTSYLITGASRGLGAEYARQLLASSDSALVVAAAREPNSAKLLQELKKNFGNQVYLLKMDVTDESSVKAAASELENSSFLDGGGLDVLINNAGVSTGGMKSVTESAISDLETDLKTNVFGTIHVTLAFLPLLKKGNKKQIFNVSSLAGSFNTEYTKQPIAALYSTSKTALNMFTVKLAAELGTQGFTVLPFHPGIVKTDMAGDFGQIEVEEAGEKALKNIFFKVTNHDNGKFFSYSGEELAW